MVTQAYITHRRKNGVCARSCIECTRAVSRRVCEMCVCVCCVVCVCRALRSRLAVLPAPRALTHARGQRLACAALARAAAQASLL